MQSGAFVCVHALVSAQNPAEFLYSFSLVEAVPSPLKLPQTARADRFVPIALCSNLLEHVPLYCNYGVVSGTRL